MADELPPVQPQRPRLNITLDSLPPEAPPAAEAPAAAAPLPPVSASPPTPAPPAAPPPLPAVKPPHAPAHQTYCHACGRGLDPRAMVCPSCGVAQHAQSQLLASHTNQMAAITLGQKSPGVAILLSLLVIPGAGQWYMNRVGRGFAFCAAWAFSWIMVFFVIGLIFLPIVHIWAAVDANGLAKRHNAELVAQVTGVVNQPGL